MLLFFEAFDFEKSACQLLQSRYLLFAIRNFFLVNDKSLQKYRKKIEIVDDLGEKFIAKIDGAFKIAILNRSSALN